MVRKLKWLRHSGLLVIAVMAGISAPHADEGLAPSSKTTAKSPSMPIGAACTVQTGRSGQQRSLKGTILKMDSEWLVLEHVEETTVEAGIPIPGTGDSRLFKNSTGKTKSIEIYEIWIPRDTIVDVKIRKILDVWGEPNRVPAEDSINPEAETQADAREKDRTASTVAQASLEEPDSAPRQNVDHPEPNKRKGAGKTGPQASREPVMNGPQMTYIIASPAILRNGTRCRIALHQTTEGWCPAHTSQTAYEGKLLKTTDDKILLAAEKVEGRSSQEFPVLSDFTCLRRFRENTGVGRKKLDNEEIWIPIHRIAAVSLLDDNDGAGR